MKHKIIQEPTDYTMDAAIKRMRQRKHPTVESVLRRVERECREEYASLPHTTTGDIVINDILALCRTIRKEAKGGHP